MAKSLNNTKITIETETERYRFKARQADVGSTDNGFTHFLTTSALLDMEKTTLQPFTEWSIGGTDLVPKQSNEQAVGLRTVAQRAKAIERRKLLNARAVEGAILEAQRNLNAVEHEFNMAVLEALHTGLTHEDIEKHLDSVKLFGFEGHVETVGRFDTDSLYTLDMPNA